MSARAIEVLPRPAHSDIRAELRASQRGRLICAVADAVAAKGYGATTVGDVVALAGVSRKSFYEHFDDLEACFLASYDTGAAAILDAMVEEIDPSAGWEELLDTVLTTWLEFLDADLPFTRAYLIEFWAAGDAARERWTARRDRLIRLLRALHERIRELDPTVTPVSDGMVAAVEGGANRLVVSHVLAGDPASLIELKPELLAFIKATLASHETP
jgi:AcrR family transcriptional regulator